MLTSFCVFCHSLTARACARWTDPTRRRRTVTAASRSPCASQPPWLASPAREYLQNPRTSSGVQTPGLFTLRIWESSCENISSKQEDCNNFCVYTSQCTTLSVLHCAASLLVTPLHCGPLPHTVSSMLQEFLFWSGLPHVLEMLEL